MHFFTRNLFFNRPHILFLNFLNFFFSFLKGFLKGAVMFSSVDVFVRIRPSGGGGGEYNLLRLF